jgi:hypothetical protein
MSLFHGNAHQTHTAIRDDDGVVHDFINIARGNTRRLRPLCYVWRTLNNPTSLDALLEREWALDDIVCDPVNCMSCIAGAT